MRSGRRRGRARSRLLRGYRDRASRRSIALWRASWAPVACPVTGFNLRDQGRGPGPEGSAVIVHQYVQRLIVTEHIELSGRIELRRLPAWPVSVCLDGRGRSACSSRRRCGAGRWCRRRQAEVGRRGAGAGDGCRGRWRAVVGNVVGDGGLACQPVQEAGPGRHGSSGAALGAGAASSTMVGLMIGQQLLPESDQRPQLGPRNPDKARGGGARRRVTTTRVAGVLDGVPRLSVSLISTSWSGSVAARRARWSSVREDGRGSRHPMSSPSSPPRIAS